MQVNRVGYSMFAVFGIGGVVFAIFPATRLMGIIWVIVTIFLVAYAIQQRGRGRHDQELFRNGLRARATVVEAQQGGTLNEQPIVNLVLDLEVPGQGKRRVTDRLVMASFAARLMKPGLVLPAFVNPADPSDFFVQW